jgi:hypothetical protein
MNKWRNNPSVVKGGGVSHKGKKFKKIKTMHECCLFVVIITYVEIWRMNWEEIEKIDYVLNYEHCNLVGDYRIFM